MNYTKEEKKILSKIINPIFFAEKLFDIKLSKQQKDFLRKVKKVIDVKIKKNINKKKLTNLEKEYSDILGITVMSARGTGKDCILAIFILWFVLIYDCKIPVTAPTGAALNSVLWSEIKKWHSKIKLDCIKSLYIITNDKVRCSSGDFESFAIGRVSANGNAQALSGYHEDFMAICVDEAASIDSTVFEPLEMTLTGKVNFMILIWNPTTLDGYAYDTYHHPTLSKSWIKLQWSAIDSENVTKSSIERVAERYGINSNFYRVSVLGIPPKTSSDMLIPIKNARYCYYRQFEDETKIEVLEPDPIIIGIDPSRSGAHGCETVCCIRQGRMILDFYTPEEQLDSVKMCEEIIDKLFSKYPFTYCFIETNGLGGPIFDVLKQYDTTRIKGVNVSTKPKDERFFNMRSWMWWQLREAVIEERLALDIDIPRNKIESWIMQVSDIKKDDRVSNSSGKLKIKIESKKDMKERGVESPDYGDSSMLTFF